MRPIEPPAATKPERKPLRGARKLQQGRSAIPAIPSPRFPLQTTDPVAGAQQVRGSALHRCIDSSATNCGVGCKTRGRSAANFISTTNLRRALSSGTFARGRGDGARGENRGGGWEKVRRRQTGEEGFFNGQQVMDNLNISRERLRARWGLLGENEHVNSNNRVSRLRAIRGSCLWKSRVRSTSSRARAGHGARGRGLEDFAARVNAVFTRKITYGNLCSVCAFDKVLRLVVCVPGRPPPPRAE